MSILHYYSNPVNILRAVILVYSLPVMPILFLLAGLIELSLYLAPLWQYKKTLGTISLALLALATGMLIASKPGIGNFVIAFISFYRFINLARLVAGRSDERYLKSVGLRTSVILITAQSIFAYVYWAIGNYLSPSFSLVILLASIAQIVVALAILLIIFKNLQKIKYRPASKFLPGSSLPTITIAIPARNETPELSQCLDAIIRSSYPKMEVLVLDDCSQDKTAEIIKNYAHSGVRFLKGEEPKTKWLAKNQAYERLFKEASGEFILFCGVDIKLGKDSVMALVQKALNSNKNMISMLPVVSTPNEKLSLIQPMRYWWELALPRKLVNRPPVLSSCWLIKRSFLKKLGGFSSVERNVIPEGYFALEAIKDNHYSFLRTSGELQVTSIKSRTDQIDRAIRVRYPEIHHRLELAAFLTLFQARFLLLPFVLSIWGFVFGYSLVAVLSVMASVILVFAHGLVISNTSTSYNWLKALTFPACILTEIVLAHVSMWKYEFSVVDWKGRNICLPVMQAKGLR